MVTDDKLADTLNDLLSLFAIDEKGREMIEVKPSSITRQAYPLLYPEPVERARLKLAEFRLEQAERARMQ